MIERGRIGKGFYANDKSLENGLFRTKGFNPVTKKPLHEIGVYLARTGVFSSIRPSRGSLPSMSM
jgi:hypothetical protein